MAQIDKKTRFGSDVSYSEFEDDGTLKFIGSATVWDDQMVDIGAGKLPAVGAPSWTSYKGGQVLSFADAQTNTVYFNVQIPHSYKLGTNIDFHCHVVHAGASGGFSTWQFTYCLASIGGTFTTATTSLVTLTAPAVVDHHGLLIFPNITGTGAGISSMILCSLERHGNSGTYNGAIYIMSMDSHYEKDSIGSRQELAK